MEAKEKVIEQLHKIAKKFPSSRVLASAVETFGLFDGIVYWDEKGWHFIPWQEDEDESAIPFCKKNSVTGIEYFGASYYGATWECMLVSSGRSYLFLVFDHKTGDIISIVPDEKKEGGFWKSDDPEGRIQEIKDLIKKEEQ